MLSPNQTFTGYHIGLRSQDARLERDGSFSEEPCCRRQVGSSKLRLNDFFPSLQQRSKFGYLTFRPLWIGLCSWTIW